jgi:hypothetical protein
MIHQKGLNFSHLLLLHHHLLLDLHLDFIDPIHHLAVSFYHLLNKYLPTIFLIFLPTNFSFFLILLRSIILLKNPPFNLLPIFPLDYLTNFQIFLPNNLSFFLILHLSIILLKNPPFNLLPFSSFD